MNPRCSARWVGTVALIASALASGSAAAQTVAGYHAMRWNTCYGDAGASARSFACDTNVGTDVLVVSVFPPAALPQFYGAQVKFQVVTTGENMPNWWQAGSGWCRPNAAISASFVPPAGSASCTDAWQGGASGGMTYSFSAFAPTRSEFQVVCAIPVAFSVPAGAELFICSVGINHQQTVGTGSCGGCSSALCIGLCSVWLMQPIGFDYFETLDPLPGTASDVVGWQQSDYVMPYVKYVQHGPQKDFTGCNPPVPTARRTWGGIKSLYR